MREDATNLISVRAIDVLRAKLIGSGISKDLVEACRYTVTRTSKWIVEILFFRGLSAVGKFKVNVREGSIKRVL